MSYPHDYYKFDPDHPELHNRGEERPYFEPDWHSHGMHDAQLPALSAIGRGPRGEGLYVGAQVNQDGEISFTLNSTLTGEAVWESPNLAPWEVEFTPTVWADIVAGIPAALDIKQTRGNQTHTTHAYLPPGQEGSRIFMLGGVQEKADDNTYTTTVADLTIYGRAVYQNRPVPRPNDIVIFAVQDSTGYSLGVGSIDNVGGTTRENYGGGDIPTPTNVVFTCNMYVPTFSTSIDSVYSTSTISNILSQETIFQNRFDIVSAQYSQFYKIAQLAIKFKSNVSISGNAVTSLCYLAEDKIPKMDTGMIVCSTDDVVDDVVLYRYRPGITPPSLKGEIQLATHNINPSQTHAIYCTYLLP